MKKLALLVFVVGYLLQTVSAMEAKKMIVFSYEKPYQYELINGTYKVKATIKNESWVAGSIVRFNEEELKVTKLENGDMQILLPLIGNSGIITVKKGKKNIISTQHFEPLIPADWDYFADGKIHLIVSSHQDIGWMDVPDTCRKERVHDITIPALDLMEKEPEFKFEMEQSLNLMEVLEDSPENKQRLIDTYKSGNFEWGATFTQPYEGLESSEQLVRQSYLGRRWIKKNLPGMDAHVAYNVDIPGRSLQVPQLFKKSGIDYLFVSRMKEGFYNWYSPDGTSIFTYSPGNYGWFHYHHKVLDEDAITALHELHKTLKSWNEYYRERNIPPHYGAVISADAGGPESYKEVIDAWNEIAKNAGIKIPELAHSTALEFLKEIDVPEAKIDSIYGERPNLWLYIHGAAHYEAVKAKREAAVTIPSAEIFNTINCELNNDFSLYPQKELDKAWYNAIYPDHGWGGKNGHITDSVFRVALETGNEIGTKLLNSSLNSIAKKVDLKNTQNIVVFNDLSWSRDGNATVDISNLKGTNWIVTDNNGDKIPTQLVTIDGKKELVFSLSDMPSIGYKTFTIKKGKRNVTSINTGSNFCDNQFYTVELGQGGITRLYDKKLKREIFNTTSMLAGDLFHMGYTGNGAGEFVTMQEPNFAMDRADDKKSSWELIESGAVYSKFQSAFEMDTFNVEQNITVFHKKKQIDLEYVIPNWPGTQNRQLRVLFPLQMKNDAQISYDVPMGMVHIGKDELTMRPGGFAWGGTYRQKSEEIRPREIQNFITANGNGFGFTMSTNVVTADWVDPSMNSADYPVINSVLLSSHKSCHWQGNWYDQKGSHTFKFSITSHEEGWKNGFHFGIENNHPLLPIVKANKQKGSLPAEKSFVSTSNPFAVITTMKKAEDDNDVVIRVVETEGVDKKVEIKLNNGFINASKTDMIEENPKRLNQKGNVLQIELGKSAVETYKLK
ncbi:glycosyl hydrolase-related protein [Labilibaculum sp. DW002]|uniref:Glycosyl hydrolase-related protein n=1 Tax=Paralabilibaculum antarcticum TaxID=2912572 RepID=A0ABT5VPP9_9BACT|nr:glycosyl hydrolase-related protein [Labilibaculum sp. DW002]MDE5417409.1 glycosyl hydrolase-related protein [Labilibaculum sp. DW002]